MTETPESSTAWRIAALTTRGACSALESQFVIDRALVEEAIGVGFLEVHLADLDAGNVRGDSQDGCARALGVIEAIDEVEVSRAA